ncbi:MAG: methylmalonyl-CoA mutase cobalamin-binding domain/chain [Parasphingorhabdus sp.]|jgi:methylmalonyl-CoA mutase cobalamin-binding domain/chain
MAIFMPAQTETLNRRDIFPEIDLPNVSTLLTEAKAIGPILGGCPFLQHQSVSSEYQYKQRQAANGHIMLHGQIGYRSLQQSVRAYREIHEQLGEQGYGIDRYGLCLDWSMGYAEQDRQERARGTGLILGHADEFLELTDSAPVAPHFGDFVMGMPAALENTRNALKAGATSIGNLGQYFTFRLPDYDDDVFITAQTIKAIALCAQQPVPIIVHSNLDDGFAALFSDMTCALGAVMLEQTVVEDLLGGVTGHCFGHTYSEPLTRLAFGIALTKNSKHPGTMIYGNTTSYEAELSGNFASLANYLGVDIMLQRLYPSGHAINPVPVTEAIRIPSIAEVVEAHLFANRMISHSPGMQPLIDVQEAENLAEKILIGGRQFHANVLNGLAQSGIDTGNPFEMLLAMRRIGARKLEKLYGPGKLIDSEQRQPVVESTTLRDIRRHARSFTSCISAETRQILLDKNLTICTVTTDVHEYGKILLEHVFSDLDIKIVDGGVCTDPDDLAELAHNQGVDVIAISTYNGVALNYIQELKKNLHIKGISYIPVYIGGKLNQVSDEANSSDLPVDVQPQLEAMGAIPCTDIDEMLSLLGNPQSISKPHR